jgi:hypothetical protein
MLFLDPGERVLESKMPYHCYIDCTGNVAMAIGRRFPFRAHPSAPFVLLAELKEGTRDKAFALCLY